MSPQARADGDAPNPNANRLPLRAAALVLADQAQSVGLLSIEHVERFLMAYPSASFASH